MRDGSAATGSLSSPDGLSEEWATTGSAPGPAARLASLATRLDSIVDTLSDGPAISDQPRYRPHSPTGRKLPWGEPGENEAPSGSAWGGSTTQTGSTPKAPGILIAAGQSHPPGNFCRSAPRGRRLQEDLVLGRHFVCSHVGGDDLRDELREHARAGWRFGYPFAILLMAGVCVSLYFIFKRRDWL